jgi:predicted NUDIX family phosphoesterase
MIMGMGEDILVVKRELLFKDKSFEGFLPLADFDYFSVIMGNFEYQTRTEELEHNKEWQQPTTYVWIINPQTKNVFLYKRSKTGNEGRLYDKYSGGVGGHIDKVTEEYSKNPIMDAMVRELKEEVSMNEYPLPEVIGFIKLLGGIEEFHFGIVGLAKTTQEVEPAEDMAFGKFYSLEEASSILESSQTNVERWTLASWPHIKKIITNL